MILCLLCFVIGWKSPWRTHIPTLTTINWMLMYRQQCFKLRLSHFWHGCLLCSFVVAQYSQAYVIYDEYTYTCSMKPGNNSILKYCDILLVFPFFGISLNTFFSSLINHFLNSYSDQWLSPFSQQSTNLKILKKKKKPVGTIWHVDIPWLKQTLKWLRGGHSKIFV